MSRRIRGPFLLAAACALASAGPGRAQPVTAQPIPITVNSQTLCHTFGFDPPTAGCTTGGAIVQHDFAEFDAPSGLNVEGSIRAENTGGAIVYRIVGLADNFSASPRVLMLSAEQPSSFTVPANLIAGTTVPSTLVSSTLSTISSSLNANVGRELRFEPIGVQLQVSSAVLGSNVMLEITDVVLRSQLSQPTGDRDVRKESLPAGDEIELTFIPRYYLQVEGSSLASFDETHRFELHFVPEPSQPLALSSGLGLLAVLATRRLADL